MKNTIYNKQCFHRKRRRSSLVEHQLPKLRRRVRFPSPASLKPRSYAVFCMIGNCVLSYKNAPRGCALGAKADGCRSNRASARECALAHSFSWSDFTVFAALRPAPAHRSQYGRPRRFPVQRGFRSRRGRQPIPCGSVLLRSCRFRGLRS